MLFIFFVLASIIFLFYIRLFNPSNQIPKEQISNTYIKKTQAEFNTWTTCLVPKIIGNTPLSASFMYGNLSALGLENLSSELNDFSPKFFQTQVQNAQDILQHLNTVDYSALDREQQQTYEMLTFQNQLVVEGAPYLYYQQLLDPGSGMQINLPISLIQIELNNTADIDAYLNRLHQFPRVFNQLMDYLEVQAENDLLLPEFIYDLVLKQINQLLVAPQEFMIYVAFEEQIDGISDLTPELKESYKKKCLDTITFEIYPAYQKLAEMISEIKKQSTTTQGVCSFPDGKAYYEYIIKAETSYDMTAEDLRQWVTNQLHQTVATIQQLYEDYPELRQINNYSDFLPTYSSIDELYALEENCLKEQFYDYHVTRATEHIIPSYLEQYVASGFYFPITIDGSKYGNMYLQKNAYSDINTTTLELYFHENIPGHHLYFSKFYESPLPMIRKVSTWLPYEEGWAQYVQSISIDYYGLNEPLTKLIKATSQLSYYYLLLVDIRFHYDGMTTDAALKVFTDLGFPEAASQKILNRMIAHPGEIIHYVYGAYKMNRYRLQCQESLGKSFNIKDFHDMILNHAELPFTTMDYVVEDYILSF